jgi:flagellar protein FlaI
MSSPSDAPGSVDETPASRPDVDPDEITGHSVTYGEVETDVYSELRSDIGPLLASDTFQLEEEYWLQEYQSAAAIFTNTSTGEQLYHVMEPDLTEDEYFLYTTLEDRLREKILLRESTADRSDLAGILRERIQEIIGQLRTDPSPESVEKITYFLQRNLIGHGRIQPLMHDPKLEEISCNGPGDKPLFVFHQEYDNAETNIRFDEGELRPYVRKLAQRAGKDITTANPTQGTTLTDGSRVQLTLDEVSPDGETFTIRKFRDTPFTPVDLINHGTFSAEQLAYLWYLVENDTSGIVAGGTGAGKTTSLNAMALFINPGEKVVTIEDTREVKIPQKNYVSTLTREGFTSQGDEDIDMFDLLVSSLRMRPEYLIVGEVRDEEAYNLFQAMNTGHTSYATLHADSMHTVLSRLQSDPMNIPKTLIAELGFTTVQTTAEVDGEKVRRCQAIYEVIDLDAEADEIKYRPLFEWDPETDTMRGDIGKSQLVRELRRAGKDPEPDIADRQRVLEYLVDNSITGYDPVTSIVRAFMRAPDAVLEQVDAEYIDLEALSSFENQRLYEENVQ